MAEMTSQIVRRKLFIGNWKLNLTAPEARQLVRQLRARIDRDSEVLSRDRDLVLAPPLLAIPAVSEELAGSSLCLAAQNMYCEDCGPFTGEVSAPMLKVFRVTYAIVGHSERRDIFKEDDELANRKLLHALRHGLIPVLCVGEHREERGHGRALEIVLKQIESGVRDVEEADVVKVAIAYEPVWAIGTGRIATPRDVELMHASIRGALLERYGRDVAHGIRIVYGGSIAVTNVDAIMSLQNVDGVIVGAASLEADSFSRIVKTRTLAF